MISNKPVIIQDNFMPVCSWSLDNAENEQVPLITGNETYFYQYYYDAITGQDSTVCCGFWYSVDELKQMFQSEDIEYAVIVKEGGLYTENQTFWDSFDVVNQYGQFCVIHIN